MKKIRVLSIDGGGIRGILPGTILTYLEKRIKEKTGNANATIGQYFDFIAGTSTGGILALVLLCPDKNKNHKFSAQEAVNLYLEHGHKIFDISLRQKITSMDGLADEKYDATALEQILKEYLGDATLEQALKPCLITSYEITNRKAHFFTSSDAGADAKNFYLRDVARATSAAPTYFQPAHIKSLYGAEHALIDGGVFANNPALCAYSEARGTYFSKIFNDKMKPDKPRIKDMMIVSIGTGTVKEPYYYKDFKNAGVVKWIKPLIDILMSGNAETVDYQLRQMYDAALGNLDDYHRIQPDIVTASAAMDNADPKNLEALHQDGMLAVEKHQAELNTIVDKLIDYQ